VENNYHGRYTANVTKPNNVHGQNNTPAVASNCWRRHYSLAQLAVHSNWSAAAAAYYYYNSVSPSLSRSHIIRFPRISPSLYIYKLFYSLEWHCSTTLCCSTEARLSVNYFFHYSVACPPAIVSLYYTGLSWSLTKIIVYDVTSFTAYNKSLRRFKVIVTNIGWCFFQYNITNILSP